MAKILFSGCRSGLYPLEYALAHVGDEIHVHAYDAYQARKIREDVGSKAPNVRVICAGGLSDAYDGAFYYATSKLVSAELELDTLQDIYLHLVEGGRLQADGVSRETLEKVFPKGKPVKRGDLKRVRKFAAEFEASVPNGNRLKLMSLPGCFCHRRADEGGLALAECVCREKPDAKAILDIGCGCGLGGLLAAEHLGAEHLTLLDSHARAVAAAETNARNLGVAADCVLSDDGLAEDHPLKGKFTLALANPPYYGEGKIADLFAKIAFDSLAVGGSVWMVAKTPDVIREALGTCFGEVTEFKRRGYAILRAVRE